MSGLMDEERKKLLNAVKKIHVHKLVQVKGYRTLVERASNKRIRQILIHIADNEEKHAEFWSDRIEELGGEREGVVRSYLRDRKVGFMMSILGTRGLFEWAVVGEDEGIQDLAIQAERIKDTAVSETWSRFAADERMHLERMKSDMLGMEGWEIRGGGGVGTMIAGAYAGFFSTLAFVAGVVGSIKNPHIVLISGLTKLLAGSLSVAAGAYLSSKSVLEVLERESQRERVKKGRSPEEEREELIRFYQAEGFKGREAEAIVDRIVEEKKLQTQVGTLKELGLARASGNPIKTGVLRGVSYGLVALVPISPFAFKILSCMEALTVSISATLAALFGIGAMKTIFSRKNWVRSGLEMMLIGALFSAITYSIGKFL